MISIYLTLALGGPTGQGVYSALVATRPDLFYPPVQALPLIGFGLLERVTSLLFHVSWGYLCLNAALLHKRTYLLLALPMGLVDFFVPFAPVFGLPLFEAFIFALALGSVAVTLLATRNLRGAHQY